VQIEYKGNFMEDPKQGGCCGCIAVFIVFNLLFGGFLFDYCLYSILGKNIHWLGDTANNTKTRNTIFISPS